MRIVQISISHYTVTFLILISYLHLSLSVPSNQTVRVYGRIFHNHPSNFFILFISFSKIDFHWDGFGFFTNGSDQNWSSLNTTRPKSAPHSPPLKNCLLPSSLSHLRNHLINKKSPLSLSPLPMAAASFTTLVISLSLSLSVSKLFVFLSLHLLFHLCFAGQRSAGEIVGSGVSSPLRALELPEMPSGGQCNLIGVVHLALLLLLLVPFARLLSDPDQIRQLRSVRIAGQQLFLN